MSQEHPQEIRKEIYLKASPPDVFDFFTSEEKIKLWNAVEATLDPRPGGIFRVNITGKHIARGEYVEVKPPRRISYTWGWEGEDSETPPGSSTVEVTLVPEGEGTKLTLVHKGLPYQTIEPHTEGWTHYLSRLEVVVSGGDPGSDPWAE